MPNDQTLPVDAEPPSRRGSKANSPHGDALLQSTSDSDDSVPKKGKRPHLKAIPRGTAARQDNERAAAFRARYFPQASINDWNDWHWQIRNRITDAAKASAMLRLSDDEREGLLGSSGQLPMSVTPYYMSLINPDDPTAALRRCVIPTQHECALSPGEAVDPLGEEHDSPVPGLVHRYPDRVLFLATDFCSTYCRYCTRSRLVGRNGGYAPDRERWQKAIDYIAATPQVRDVVLSGGDPLTMPDEALAWLLTRLRAIPHLEIIRIGTKVPAVLPQRVTRALTRMLRQFHPLFMSLHFAHPDELTPETAQACERLADAGIPLGSQTVLLKGLNDDVPTMTRLMQGLLRIRVRPYYLYQCDPIQGSAHFRTPVETGLRIIDGLRGFTSGYAVPAYVIDAPGGGGKVPLLSNHVEGYDGADLVLRSYKGSLHRYADPGRAEACRENREDA